MIFCLILPSEPKTDIAFVFSKHIFDYRCKLYTKFIGCQKKTVNLEKVFLQFVNRGLFGSVLFDFLSEF